MRTLASVDLPDPLGPMIAWISPGRILRSTPFRISLPSTVAWRSSTSRIGSVIVHSPLRQTSSVRGHGAAQVHIVSLDLDLEGRHGLGSGQAPDRPRAHRELGAVLRA